MVSVFVACQDTAPVRKTVIVVGAAAVVFRLTVWPLAPAFSDDVFRYRWEGMLQAHGGNPYQSRPVDPEWEDLRDETFPRISAPDAKAGYGPLFELIEAWTYRAVSAWTGDAVRQAFWFKAPAALFDLGIILALWALLTAHGLPSTRLLIYAWCPLPVIEFWGNGHNDAVALFFVVLALLMAARERWLPAFAALSLAACAKIWPLVLFPVFVGRRGWRPARWWQWVVIVPVTALLSWSYWSDVEENVRFLSGFVGGWRNNDSLFGLLLWATGDPFRAKTVAFALMAVAVLFVWWKRWPLEKASLLVISVMLLVSANCHPWYLSWIVPLLAVVPVPAFLLWIALMPLAYRVVIAWALLGQWDGSTPWRWLIYVPVFALLAGSGIIKLLTSRRTPYRP
jgi:hypothetical protein